MKPILLTTLFFLISGKSSDFPKFDLFHANCEMSTTITGSCDDVWKALSTTIKTMADPAQGTYKLKEESTSDYVWTTRTSLVKKYIDDVIFQI